MNPTTRSIIEPGHEVRAWPCAGSFTIQQGCTHIGTARLPRPGEPGSYLGRTSVEDPLHHRPRPPGRPAPVLDKLLRLIRRVAEQPGGRGQIRLPDGQHVG